MHDRQKVPVGVHFYFSSCTVDLGSEAQFLDTICSFCFFFRGFILFHIFNRAHNELLMCLKTEATLKLNLVFIYIYYLTNNHWKTTNLSI